MDKKTGIIIVLSLVLGIILIGIVGSYGHNKIAENYYNQGVRDAGAVIHQQILQSLQDEGYVSVSYESDGQMQTINLIPYEVGE